MGASAARLGQRNIHVGSSFPMSRRTGQRRVFALPARGDNDARLSGFTVSPRGGGQAVTGSWRRPPCGCSPRHLSFFLRGMNGKETVRGRTDRLRGGSLSIHTRSLTVSQERYSAYFFSFSLAGAEPFACFPSGSASPPFRAWLSSLASRPKHPGLRFSLSSSFPSGPQHASISRNLVVSHASKCALQMSGCVSCLFPCFGLRFKRYIPFHKPKNLRTKNAMAVPPPLFAAATVDPMRHSVSSGSPSDAGYALSECVRLSPFHAVRVLQAFLPPATNRLAEGKADELLFTLKNGPLGYTYGPLPCAELPAPGANPDLACKMRTDDLLGEHSLVHLTLNVAADLKRESVRGVCTLQHGVGSNVRLAVFCPDEEAPAMLALGADYAGVDALVPRIAKGWVAFDKTLAVASVMPKLLKVARVLGPRKLMPSPKSGSVVANLSEAVRAVKSGECVEFRAEGEAGEVRVVIGRTDFAASQLLDNIKCVVKEVLKARPRSSGASKQEEASQNFAQAFVWPPPHFAERRRRLLMQKNLLPAIPELGAGRARDQKAAEDAFIVGGRLSAHGTPAVEMNPFLLSPSSVGYYR